MIDEQQPGTSQSAAPARPKLRDLLKLENAQRREAMTHAQPVLGKPNQVLIAALLGVCIVFFAAFVAVSHLDTPLHVASLAFAAASSLLGLAFVLSYFEFPSGLSKGQELRTKAIKHGAENVFEAGGFIAVLVGLTAVVWHLSVWAVIVGYGAAVVASVAFMAVAASYELRHQGDLAEVPSAAPADEAPQPDSSHPQESPR